MTDKPSIDRKAFLVELARLAEKSGIDLEIRPNPMHPLDPCEACGQTDGPGRPSGLSGCTECGSCL